MTIWRSSWVVPLFLAFAWPMAPWWAAAAEPDRAGIDFFETKIRPVLAQHCYECHSEKAAAERKLKGGLLVDSRDGLLEGGDSGEVILAGKPDASPLLEALRHGGEIKMPPKGKLPDAVLADFAKWIELGAPDPRSGSAAVGAKVIDIEAGRNYWAFKPLAQVTPPAVQNAAWVRTDIDRFILAELENKSLAPNPPANKERLIRRAALDLCGLPPTPAEIDAFLADESPEALAKVVDRLLDSPRYGERWARHWLDIARFAESGGYEFDGDRQGAFHYRDYVIRAFNDDQPYDEFVRWQIAGDHLRKGEFIPATATGYLVAGPYPGQTTAKTIELIRYNHLDDMVSTIGTSLLGLSVGCARCHAHKYDPIAQEDYYRLIANLSRTDSTTAQFDLEPEANSKLKAEFDAPDAIQSLGSRAVTTVPAQSLALMNSPMVRTRAEKLAQRVAGSPPQPLAESLTDAFRVALGRRPSEAEHAELLAFGNAQADSYGPNGQATALADVCQLLLCMNEFAYID